MLYTIVIFLLKTGRTGVDPQMRSVKFTKRSINLNSQRSFNLLFLLIIASLKKQT